MPIPRYLRYLAVVLWIGYIWFNSAHSTPPGDPIGTIVEIVEQTVANPPTIPGKSLGFTVGKLGHVLEFTILAVLISFAATPKPYTRPALSIGLLVAGVDEFIQSYVPGRESTLRDVGIDFLGLVLGLGLFYLLSLAVRHSKGTSG